MCPGEPDEMLGEVDDRSRLAPELGMVERVLHEQLGEGLLAGRQPQRRVMFLGGVEDDLGETLAPRLFLLGRGRLSDRRAVECEPRHHLARVALSDVADLVELQVVGLHVLAPDHELGRLARLALL